MFSRKRYGWIFSIGLIIFLTAASPLDNPGVGEANDPVTWTGIHTNTGQPCFLALNSAQDVDQTGGGSAATVDFDNEIYDQGGNFASDTFTVPSTNAAGRFLLSATVRFSGTTSAGDLITLNLVTSNRTYTRTFGTTNDVLMFTTVSITVIADMEEDDTVTVTFATSGETGTPVDIDGNAAPQTWFSGCKLA